MSDSIKITGAREHNLRNINLEIPRGKLVVITGLSGSGKSSLAFDTIYAEGQRRYVESLSAYARQFLGQLEKPDVDSIEGLSPAISIEQKTTHRNPRSTVGTVTEIYDYLRLIFARIGRPHCPNCRRRLQAQSIDSIIDQIYKFREHESYQGSVKLQILSPIIRLKKGEFSELFERIRKEGFVRVRVDGKVYNLEEDIRLRKNLKHSIEIVIDRVTLRDDNDNSLRTRLADSMELALEKGNQQALLLYSFSDSKTQEHVFSSKLSCPHCDISFPEITHRFFSFNSPDGACKSCSGLGSSLEFHPELLIRDPNRSLSEGIIEGLGWSGNGYWYTATIQALSKKYCFSVDTSWEKLPKKIQDIILYGSGDKLKYEWSKDDRSFKFSRIFEGIIPNLHRRYQDTNSDYMRRRMEQYMSNMLCPKCEGKRLREEALSVLLKQKNISEITALNLIEARDFFENLQVKENEKKIIRQALKEVTARLDFLVNVGVGYLNLDRTAGTLSGGEAQRIRLATQIGSALMGVLYVLDEPSIGLHQSDNSKLIKTLKGLRDLGNTIIVVEHDEETIENADHIVDIGPGAGIHGGKIIHSGNYKSLLRNQASVTGQYLSGNKKINIPPKIRTGLAKSISIIGASENNLKNINVDFPLGKFICVTGLSGSGKSSLVKTILHKGARNYFTPSHDLPGKHEKISGFELIDKVINIDQSPIGRTPRSNPVTYADAFTPIREIFSQLPASKMRGYRPGRFSFNVAGGRCEACEGDGLKKIEMHFLADVYVVCEVCKGRRYNRETLEVLYKGKNIHDILQMSLEEGLKFFEAIPKVYKKIEALCNVGLGYVKLGQPATTLSGGEAQRVKLAKELSKISTGKTLYILDEPTTGLHFEDIRQLLKVLHHFVDKSNTVVVIEHNMDVIKTADWIIDLGPGGGQRGGYIVAQGTREEIIESKDSLTGKYLRKWL